MAFPDLGVGHRLTALDMTFIVPQVARKTSDTTLAVSSTTAQSDPDLTLPVVTGAVYWLSGHIFYIGSPGAIKTGYAIPAGATLVYVDVALHNSVTAASSGITEHVIHGSALTQKGYDATTEVGSIFSGVLTVSTTAGNITFQAAQQTSNATAPIIKAGSILSLKRLS